MLFHMTIWGMLYLNYGLEARKDVIKMLLYNIRMNPKASLQLQFTLC